MTEKVLLTKSAFSQLIKLNGKINIHDYSEMLQIYLSLSSDGYDSSNIAYMIAKCYFNLSDFDSAEMWIKKAIAVEPLEKYILFLGDIYECKYDYDSAIKIILERLKENPDNEEALHKAVWFYIEPGGEEYFTQEFVKECLNKLIRKNSEENLSFYCLELAKIEFSDGNYSVAEELLNKAVMTLQPLSKSMLYHINELMEKIWDKK